VLKKEWPTAADESQDKKMRQKEELDGGNDEKPNFILISLISLQIGRMEGKKIKYCCS